MWLYKWGVGKLWSLESNPDICLFHWNTAMHVHLYILYCWRKWQNWVVPTRTQNQKYHHLTSTKTFANVWCKWYWTLVCILECVFPFFSKEFPEFNSFHWICIYSYFVAEPLALMAHPKILVFHNYKHKTQYFLHFISVKINLC